MRVTLAAIGKLKDGPERDLFDRYWQRLEASGRRIALTPCTLIELPESRAGAAPTSRPGEAPSGRAEGPSSAPGRRGASPAGGSPGRPPPAPPGGRSAPPAGSSIARWRARPAELARAATKEQLAAVPDDSQLLSYHALALADLGRGAEAIRAAERAVELLPGSKDAVAAPYARHQLVRVYILAGEHGKAIDVLEPLLRIPYYLTPGWLRIDPSFDPLRKHPRFQKLVG